MTVPVSDLQAIAPSAIIELFVLELNITQHGVNDIYRFHAGTNLNNNGELVWAGNNYLRFPIEADGFEYSGNGQLPRPKVRVSNVFGTITALLLSLPSGLEGAKFTRIRTLARYIDGANFPGGTNPYGTPDPTAEFPQEIFYIDRKTAENRDVVEFELAAAFDLAGIRAPKRQCIANICQWEYRSAECSYTGADYYDENDNPVATLAADVCGKRLSSCQARFNAFIRTGTVATGSNVLTVTNPLSASLGTPIKGFGIASGTTVSAVSGTGLIVTMSANATASSTGTKTGTIQSNRTELIVSNTTGLATGMTVTGPNIPAGTTITGILGTTLTLSQQANETYTLSTTRSARLYRANELQINSSTAGLSVGMAVIGAGLPQNYSAKITSIGVTRIFLSLSGDTSFFYSSYNFYTIVPYTSQTYTFTSNTNYIFRNPNNNDLPFGSYPGIGAFGA